MCVHERVFISVPWHRKRRCIGSESPAYSVVRLVALQVLSAGPGCVIYNGNRSVEKMIHELWLC